TNPVLAYVNCADNAGYYEYTGEDQDNYNEYEVYSYTAYLTELNTEGAIALNYLDCSGNAISSLDVSSNPALIYLNCYNNRDKIYDYYYNFTYTLTPHLTALNMKNGNNTLLSFFDAKENDYLGCIEVDDAVYAQSVWSGSVDATASFS